MYVNHILDILNCLLRAVSGICWTMYVFMRPSTRKSGITWHKLPLFMLSLYTMSTIVMKIIHFQYIHSEG